MDTIPRRQAQEDPAMKELLTKGLHIGLGLASMTKDKIEAVARDWAESAKLPEEEGKKLAKTLQEEAEKAKANLKTTVEALVENAAKKLPCCKRMDKLEKRIAALEAAAGIKPESECASGKCDCANG